MSDGLKTPQRRAIQYFFVDGTFELGFGLLTLILGAYFYLSARVEEGLFSALLDVSLVLVLLGGAWLANSLVRKVKEKVTYPRTGFVAYRRNGKSKRGWRMAVGLVVGGLVAALTAVLVSAPFPGMDVLPVLTGIVMGIILGIIAWRVGLIRIYVLAAVCLLLGFGLGFARLMNDLGVAAFYGGLGGLLLVAGGLTMGRYLRQNPTSQEEQNER
jgi:hypothetical protein